MKKQTRNEQGMTFESVIEWAASWVPEANRVRFSEALKKELESFRSKSHKESRDELLKTIDDLEKDLEEAGRLLKLANPDNRHWMEKRDQFLEKLGYPMEQPNE